MSCFLRSRLVLIFCIFLALPLVMVAAVGGNNTFVKIRPHLTELFPFSTYNLTFWHMLTLFLCRIISQSWYCFAWSLLLMTHRLSSNILKIQTFWAELFPFFDVEIKILTLFLVPNYFPILILLCMKLTINELQIELENRKNLAMLIADTCIYIYICQTLCVCVSVCLTPMHAKTTARTGMKLRILIEHT